MTVQPPKKKRWPYILGGIVLLLIVGVAIGLSRLDAMLLERARTEAAQLSQTLGRPVEIGDISTRLFPHIGVEVDSVTVGAAEGEQVPLVSLQKLQVGVALSPLVSSRGDDIQVTNAEASGLTLNVVRLPDGTTNVSRLQDKLAAQQKPEEPPAGEQAPTDLSRVRVDRAALTDGTIRFIDRSEAQPRELAISDIDIEVKDLRAGKPLEAVLNAAVLAQKQNFQVKVQTAPLPPSLTPVPERITLKAEPIDLAPLAPFLGPDVGLQGGTVQADWNAELGAAVPGGTGPTRLQGGLRAQGLRFAGAEGGKALDVVLDTDVTGDVKAGDLTLTKLLMELGPARLTGKGQVKGLLSETPAVQDFELVGQNLDPAQLADYYPPLRKQLAGQVAGPIGLVVRGGGTQDKQSLTLSVDLTPVRLRIPEELSKEAGAPMKLSAHLTGAGDGGALSFTAQLDLAGADLRPGELLDKQPGQKLDVTMAGSYAPSRGKEPMKVDLPTLRVDVREYTLSGTASFSSGTQGKQKTTTFALALKSPKLNYDELMLSDEEVTAYTGKEPAPSSSDTTRFNGYRGAMKFDVAQLRMKDMDFSNLVAELKMVDDLITVERFSTGLYGGTVSAHGSSVRLGPVPAARPFEAKMEVQGVAVDQVLATRMPRKALSGKFDGKVDLKGVGYEKDSLAEKLVGAINGTLLGGAFLGMDVPAAVTAPLAKALPFAAKAVQGDVTQLAEQLPFGVRIENGVAQLEKPITWTRPEAAMSFEGGVRLDGTLNLTGTVNLAPPLIQKMTLNKVTPTESVPVGLKLTGPAWKPQVEQVDVKPAATTLAKLAAASTAKNLLGGEKGEAVGKIISGGPEAAKEAARAEAEKRQRELEEKARQEAEAAKQRAAKKAEEEAKKRLKGLFGK
jgi:AsmA protein